MGWNPLKAAKSFFSGGLSDVFDSKAPFTGALENVNAPSFVQDMNKFANDVINPASRGGRVLGDLLSGKTGWAEATDQLVDIPMFGSGEGEQGLIDYGFRELGTIQPQWFKDTMSSLGTGVGAYLYGPGGAAAMAGLADKAQQGPVPQGMGREDRNDLYRRGFKNAGTAATLSYLLGGDAGADYDVAMMGDTLSAGEKAALYSETAGAGDMFNPTETTISPEVLRSTDVSGAGEMWSPDETTVFEDTDPSAPFNQSPEVRWKPESAFAEPSKPAWYEEPENIDKAIKMASKLSDMFNQYGQTGGSMQSIETGAFGGTPTPTNEWINYLSGGRVKGGGKLMAGAGEAGLGDMLSLYPAAKKGMMGYDPKQMYYS